MSGRRVKGAAEYRDCHRNVGESTRFDMTEPEVLDTPRAPRSADPADGRTPPVAHSLTHTRKPCTLPRREGA